MTERRERSAEEREAARREREARRAAREGRPAPPPSSSPAPAPAPLEQVWSPSPEPVARPSLHEEEPFTEEHALEESDGHFDDGHHDGDFEYEAPAGTRRVQGTPAAAGGDRRSARDRLLSGRGRLWGRGAALLAVVLVIAVGWFMIELWQPFHGAPGAPVTVVIPKHSSSGQIGDQLARAGVIPSSFFFGLRAALAGDRGKLLAGTYHLRRDESYGAVLKTLITPPPPIPTTQITIVEGKSRDQIDALLHAQGVRGSYAKDSSRSPLLSPRAYGAPASTPTLEGFLFPSTYTLREPVRIPDLVAAQVRTFKEVFPRVNLSYARSKNLSPYDVLIIASIIEKEAATAHDRPLVASVIYNRLHDHIPLGMDSTTRYEFNDYTKPLTQSQLSARSPYNTRLHAGLPPTPVGNPGLAAIQAAAHPARTSYLYFVVKPCGNGASVFSSNYQQFLADSAHYQQVRAKLGGRSPVNC